jgi:hypothetical protein
MKDKIWNWLVFKIQIEGGSDFYVSFECQFYSFDFRLKVIEFSIFKIQNILKEICAIATEDGVKYETLKNLHDIMVKII